MSDVGERRNIYVIETGEYSDYTVLCAFESEDDARAASFGDGYTEMILFSAGQQPRHVTTHWEAAAIVGKTDSEKDVPPSVKSATEWDYDKTDPDEVKPYDGRPIVNVRDYGYRGDATIIQVKAADHDTALKVCSDRYAKERATREELPPPPPPVPIAHPWTTAPKSDHCLFCDDPQSHPRHTATVPA